MGIEWAGEKWDRFLVRRAMARVKGVLAVERREHFDDEDLGWV